jgi:hypothetical protein
MIFCSFVMGSVSFLNAEDGRYETPTISAPGLG